MIFYVLVAIIFACAARELFIRPSLPKGTRRLPGPPGKFRKIKSWKLLILAKGYPSLDVSMTYHAPTVISDSKNGMINTGQFTRSIFSV